MLKRLLLILMFCFYAVSDCYAVGDFSDASATGSGAKDLGKEGYYLKYAYKEFVGSYIVCDCKCTGKFCTSCPQMGGYCMCPISKYMNGALGLFGKMGKLQSQLPKVESQILRHDYVPVLLTEIGLMRTEGSTDKERDAALVAKLMDDELVGMIQGLLKDGQNDKNSTTGKSQTTRKEEEQQTSKKIADAREKLHNWIMEQMVVPRTTKEAKARLEKWEISTEMSGDYLAAPIEYDIYIEPIAAVNELIKKEYNTLKHVGMVNNYALSKAYILALDKGNKEVEESFKRVMEAKTFQSKYQRLGELQLQAMTRLNENAKISSKFAETHALYELPAVIEDIKNFKKAKPLGDEDTETEEQR